jgi:predicted nucleotidyltransferase component of viral defense system
MVAEVDEFALKGGTAINFFWRNFPRLSVDIDLTYLPIKDRDKSLDDIKKGVQHIAEIISERIHGAYVTPTQGGGTLSKLLVRNKKWQIKLEVNTVLRGTLFDPVEKELAPLAQEKFEMFAAIKCLSTEDLYGSKLCAALDRQHPRDLYDIKLLLKNEGITDRIRIAFIGYLISHSRPIHEILNPNYLELEEIFKNEFVGMTNESVSLKELRDTQKELSYLLLSSLTDKEKEFLISFQHITPQWSLVPIPHLKELPGVQWKLINLKKMDKQKHQKMGEKLKKVLARYS